MKVRIKEESKKWLTVAEMPAVRRLIEEMKDNEYSIKELAEDAMRWIVNPFGFEARILECSANIARNSRINDYYFEGSEKLDVWIEFIAFNAFDGCYMCGVYLSDIWSVGEHNRDEIRQHACIAEYRRVEK